MQQFGVDVVENSRKVTHGCIIATLKLYLPDGKEAKASPTIVSSVSSTSLPTQDLYQLHHYIQARLHCVFVLLFCSPPARMSVLWNLPLLVGC
jgi:hypothetical protein